ncbi:hypothetical protein TD95_001899 [Thielaviopsis punctulata]|uniref:Uncharacterized protein n=1 Tax=Thielaviopsis punctulata TaxID=72032 RepID=A0A0F4ZI65_9PEZI|nr:hypothetical protein TD95_001899 [Thielaviopsis punctulata]
MAESAHHRPFQHPWLTSPSQNRVGRSAHRRPLSSVIPSHATPTSPTRVTRRLSDQQETSRSRVRGGDDAHSTAGPPRTLNYRSLARDLSSAASAVGVDDAVRRAPVARSHTSAGSRSLVLQDSAPSDAPQHTSRRKPSISDGISIVTSSRSGNLKSGTTYHPRAYHSSPLASRNTSDQIILTSQTIQQQSHGQHESQAQEGTDSTTSTGPPGTVWDELDDLKSRIHRLELTGKLPNSSSSAMSRVSDDRPPTAHTAATTNSGSSPKRPTTTGVLSATGSHNADNVSTTSSQKEAPSLLHAALAQAKASVGSEVYRALELAANDALGLTMMMGTVGQPGPISSGASAIGYGGSSTITDRQLRRRAEGVIRGLTELCLALSTDSNPRTSSNPAPLVVEQAQEPPMSPTSGKTFASILQRRQNVVVEQNTPTPSSPRAISKFEERRNKLLNSPSLTVSPRYTATSPSGQPLSAPEAQPPMTAGRKSSMLLARRRTANDEVDESSGRKTSMLRTRRGGGDEGDEGSGRRTSMLLRGRRTNTGVTSDDDEPRLRAPSRAIAEVVPHRPGTRSGGDYAAALQSGDSNGAGAAAGPRRRMASALASRLGGVPPQAGVPTPRRFLERQAAERESGLSVIEKVQSEEKLQRPMSLGQAMLGRTPSLNRRAANRER